MLSHARLPPPAAVRVPMLFTGAVAVGVPLHRNATPLFSAPPVLSRSRAISHTVVRRLLLRKTPEGPDRRPGGWFRRTKGGGRPLQVLFGPAGPILAEIHQPSAPRGPRTLAMVQGATPDAASRTDTLQKAEGVFFEIGEWYPLYGARTAHWYRRGISSHRRPD
jgi:hypothetical protein